MRQTTGAELGPGNYLSDLIETPREAGVVYLPNSRRSALRLSSMSRSVGA